MNPWLVAVVLLLVVLTWAWMFDRRRRSRGGVSSPGGVSGAARRAQAHDDAVGAPPKAGD